MSQDPTITRAFVTVFEDIDSSQQVIKELHDTGFPLGRIELVTWDMQEEAPEVTTPKNHETTASSFVGNAAKWGGVGAAAGAVGAVITAFPGFGLGMIVAGGLVGAMFGGIAGLEHAVEDDSVNLPSIDEYEDLVREGNCLVVVLGDHDDAMRAKEIVDKIPSIHSHIHPVHGHEHHEHPAG